jgi:hypothetical protein
VISEEKVRIPDYERWKLEIRASGTEYEGSIPNNNRPTLKITGQSTKMRDSILMQDNMIRYFIN